MRSSESYASDVFQKKQAIDGSRPKCLMVDYESRLCIHAIEIIGAGKGLKKTRKEIGDDGETSVHKVKDLVEVIQSTLHPFKPHNSTRLIERTNLHHVRLPITPSHLPPHVFDPLHPEHHLDLERPPRFSKMEQLGCRQADGRGEDQQGR